MINDHFVVLPSNACENVHPNNTAGQFHVSWENPLELNGKGWHVALTEMNYDYSPMSVNPSYGVEYSKLSSHTITLGNYTFIWKDRQTPPYIEGPDLHDYPPKKPPFDNWKLPYFYIDEDGKICIYCTFRFSISFSGKNDAKKMGFNSAVIHSSWNHAEKKHRILALEKPMISEIKNEPLIRVEHILITLESLLYTTTHKITFPTSLYWPTTEEMMKYLFQSLEVVFSMFKYVDGRISFQIRGNITQMKLLNGFNFVMGFEKTLFANQGPEPLIWTAEHPPQHHRGLTRMYIYASCCAPIRVGDVLVPLLRSVFVDDNNDDDDGKNLRRHIDFGKTKNFIIKNPMYLPVSSTTINTIEINIRDDSGRIIPFSEGSVTSLTLHFKQNQ